MKILFLDIDGVLNSGRWLASESYQQLREDGPVDERWDAMLDPVAVALLNQITDRTGARIVVSSSWRCALDLQQLREILYAGGVTGTVIGTTPKNMGYRGKEIGAWLRGCECTVEAFTILDDDSDMKPFKAHLVKTSFADGLQPEHVEAAVEMLEEVQRPAEANNVDL